MTQRFSLYQDLSVRENLEFVARLYGVRDPAGAARAMVDRLGLKGREEQLAGSLSGGWKQRLALGACTLPNPQLLLLDEPTAGVDPKARREFWNEIHALAADGLTVLVSTHYMDEAERCHEIAYIAYGDLLVHGTVDEVIAQSHLDDLHGRRGEDLAELAGELDRQARRRHGGAVRHQPACVGPRRGGAREPRSRPIATTRRLHWEQSQPSLEDVFIDLMGRARGQFPVTRRDGAPSAPSVARLLAAHPCDADQGIHPAPARPRVVRMIVMVPLMQLLLFGYAINTTPRDLPTAVLLQETSDVGRSILAALENTQYFKITHQRARRRPNSTGCSPPARCCSRSKSRRTSSARCGAATRPAMLVAADATDPVAAGSALGALGQIVQTALRNDRGHARQHGAPPFEVRTHARYNPAAATRAQHRARACVGTILTMTMLIFTALSVTREIERGTMESLLSMPITPVEIMLGKIVPYVHRRLHAGGADHRHRRAAVRRADHRQPAAAGALSTLFITTNLSIGYTFSTIAQNQLQAMQMSMMFFLPNILLSGFMFPFAGMPVWAQWIGEALPLTHFIRIVRAIMLKGSTLPDLHYDALALAGLMLFAMTIAVTRFRRTLD